MRHLAPAAALLGVLALCGCGRKPAPSPAASQPAAASAPTGAFSSQPGFDAAGYYIPLQDIRLGTFKLAHISIGAPSDFAEWQAGKREGVFGPIIFQFEDINSPGPISQIGDDGIKEYSTRASVLPASYSFQPAKVEFRGTDSHLGDVHFSGAFDLNALSQVKDDPDETKPVLTGKLTVGDQVFPNVKFGFWVGD